MKCFSLSLLLPAYNEEENIEKTVLYIRFTKLFSFLAALGLFTKENNLYLSHYLPSLPFSILIMAFFLNQARNLSLKVRVFVVYFLICIVITFIFFYLILSAQKIPRKELRDYRWMGKNWTYILRAEKFTYKR